MAGDIMTTSKHTRTLTPQFISTEGYEAAPSVGATHIGSRGNPPQPCESSARAAPSHGAPSEYPTSSANLTPSERREVVEVVVHTPYAVSNGSVRDDLKGTGQHKSSSFHARVTSERVTWKDKSHSGEGEGVPKVLLLHHRMGYSIITLTESQRNLYKWANLEKYLLYKGQKYSCVNILGRFCIILLIIYTFGTLFLAFSMSTSSWLVLRSGVVYESYSLFVSCHDQPLRLAVCSMYALLKHHESLLPNLALCAARGSTQLKYAFTMLGVSIFHIICQIIVLFEVFWIAGRPTRSRTLLMTILFLWLCVFAGIVNIVLFPHSVDCERNACKMGTQGSPSCEPFYGWGYRLYSAVIGINVFCALMSICMYSYIHMIGQNISTQLEEERSRRCEQEAAQQCSQDHNSGEADFEAGDNMNYTVNNNSFVKCTKVKPFSMQASTTTRDGRSSGYYRLNNSCMNFSTQNRNGQAVHSPQHSSPNFRHSDVVQHLANSSPTRFSSTKSERSQARVFFLDGGEDHPRNGKEGCVASDTLPHPNAARTMPEQHLECSSPLWPVHGKETPPESTLRPQSRGVEFPHGCEIYPAEGWRPRSGECRTAGSQHNDFPEHRHVRKRRSRLSRLFRWDSNPDYITAAELGVRINGAQDWVYHDRSDMYYSFERNMFWDPLTHEYFNCALKCWQETPDKIAHTCMLATTGTRGKRRKVESREIGR
ncbi:unnamed protein product [Phytomonas sp. EM1]|nr:unnamed protein product [Phytomonas sp. EM1]|eukprot:CCW63636.1 unnamed protein product [Phytomonas sp. isolate EM1]